MDGANADPVDVPATSMHKKPATSTKENARRQHRRPATSSDLVNAANSVHAPKALNLLAHLYPQSTGATDTPLDGQTTDLGYCCVWLHDPTPAAITTPCQK
jgi:hypothetical protein